MSLLRELMNEISELGFKPNSDDLKNQLKQLEDRLMTKFSEYKTAVDETLASISALISSEAVEIKAAIDAALASAPNTPDPAVQEALTDLVAKRAQISDALKGLVSSTPSPTAPTAPDPLPPATPSEPVPPLPEMPPLVDPSIPTPTPAPVTSIDPTVPVTLEPSPASVGVDGGVSVSPI